jgi:hypothetical protein
MSRSRPPPPLPPLDPNPPPKRQASPHTSSGLGSDTYLLFEEACRETIAALESLGVEHLKDGEEGRTILAEARDLLTYFDTWKERPPASADRTSAVDRTLKLHARAAIYLEKRRHDVVG